ncbi:MAG: ATP synthase subunit alpha [Candidatus Nomurabacteria bacterium GW2011_GWA2_42_41]|nr:MAG: ATP synthase subunit alpha [Candidatus Nomurabacteria bacterium GW2011_GWA2_42_41]
MQFASDLDKETKERIEKGRRLSELLKQTNGRPLSFDKEVIVIYAGISGVIDKVKVEDMHLFEEKLMEYFDHHAVGIVDAIRKDHAISEQTEANLKSALADFAVSHPEIFIAH